MRIFVLILAFFSVILFSCSSEVDIDEIRTIKVTGTSQIMIPADYVVITFEISSLKPTPEQAQIEIDNSTQAVLAFASSLDIPFSDISTTYVYLERNEIELENGDLIFKGYLASNTMSIKLTDLPIFDALVSGVLTNGVNDIYSVSFVSEKEIETRRNANLAAIKAAKEKADYLANQLGQSVGVPIEIIEKTNSYIPQPNFLEFPPESDSPGAQKPSTTIIPTPITISSKMEVTFSLRN